MQRQRKQKYWLSLFLLKLSLRSSEDVIFPAEGPVKSRRVVSVFVLRRGRNVSTIFLIQTTSVSELMCNYSVPRSYDHREKFSGEVQGNPPLLGTVTRANSLRLIARRSIAFTGYNSPVRILSTVIRNLCARNYQGGPQSHVPNQKTSLGAPARRHKADLLKPRIVVS